MERLGKKLEESVEENLQDLQAFWLGKKFAPCFTGEFEPPELIQTPSLSRAKHGRSGGWP